jgi:hypothetical protein
MIKGQSKAEFYKNYKRVQDILDKSGSNVDKAKSLAITQANRITDEHKAINRAMAAKELSKSYNNEANIEKSKICIDIFDIFFKRAYDLGSVTKQDFRNYQLQKLLELD